MDKNRLKRRLQQVEGSRQHVKHPWAVMAFIGLEQRTAPSSWGVWAGSSIQATYLLVCMCKREDYRKPRLLEKTKSSVKWKGSATKSVLSAALVSSFKSEGCWVWPDLDLSSNYAHSRDSASRDNWLSAALCAGCMRNSPSAVPSLPWRETFGSYSSGRKWNSTLNHSADFKWLETFSANFSLTPPWNQHWIPPPLPSLVGWQRVQGSRSTE